ncbi:hypothetical protein C8Q79DRAFT_1011859 [Trametes meyenii]|nr:hypothetical protein C8Q79DRAFT_1011859 [Trametes meyenii]
MRGQYRDSSKPPRSPSARHIVVASEQAKRTSRSSIDVHYEYEGSQTKVHAKAAAASLVPSRQTWAGGSGHALRDPARGQYSYEHNGDDADQIRVYVCYVISTDGRPGRGVTVASRAPAKPGILKTATRSGWLLSTSAFVTAISLILSALALPTPLSTPLLFIMSFFVIDFSKTAGVQRSNNVEQEVVPQTPGSPQLSTPPAESDLWLSRDGALSARPVAPEESEQQPPVLYISLPEIEMNTTNESSCAANGTQPDQPTGFMPPPPPTHDVIPFAVPYMPPFIPPFVGPLGPPFAPPFTLPSFAPVFAGPPMPFGAPPFLPPAFHAPLPPAPTPMGFDPQFTLPRLLPPPPPSLWIAAPQFDVNQRNWAPKEDRFSSPHLLFFHPRAFNFMHALWEFVTAEVANTELMYRVCVMTGCPSCPNMVPMEELVEHYLLCHFPDSAARVLCPWPNCGESLDRGTFGRHFEDLHLRIRKIHCRWCHRSQRGDDLKPHAHGKACEERAKTLAGGTNLMNARKKDCVWCLAGDRKDLPQVELNARSVAVIVGPALGEAADTDNRAET